jgi:hypothetical protein
MRLGAARPIEVTDVLLCTDQHCTRPWISDELDAGALKRFAHALTLQVLAQEDPACERLMTVPGIGPKALIRTNLADHIRASGRENGCTNRPDT